MTIQHRNGSMHGNADGLSRLLRRRCKREDCMNIVPCKVATINKTGEETPETDVSKSNWIDQWNITEISRLQTQDSNINTVMQYKSVSDEKPKIDSPDEELSALL